LHVGFWIFCWLIEAEVGLKKVPTRADSHFIVLTLKSRQQFLQAT